MVSKSATISVVIPTLNEGQRIKTLLASLAAQTLSLLEIIIVDSSTDDTKKIVTESIPSFQTLGITLKYIFIPATDGIAAARQLGFSSTRSDIIASLDADSTPAPNWLEKIAAHFDHSDSVAVVGVIKYGQGPWPIRLICDWGYYRWYFWLSRIILGFNLFYGNGGAVRRSAFQKSGGFNTSTANINDLDDAELGAKLSQIGPIRCDPQIQVFSSWRWFNRPSRNLSTLLYRYRALAKLARKYG